MKTMWFLVIILTSGDVERHVAVEMPNREVCEDIAQGYVHAMTYTLTNQRVPTWDGEGSTALTRVTTLEVDEVRCEESSSHE